MNEKFKAIVSQFPVKPGRSALAPYAKLILELHRRGCSFRQIVPILSEHFGLKVASTTISRFVLRLEKEESKQPKTEPRKRKAKQTVPPLPEMPAQTVTNPTFDEIRRRIEVFKQQQPPPKSEKKIFEFDDTKPLTLVGEDEKV